MVSPSDSSERRVGGSRRAMRDGDAARREAAPAPAATPPPERRCERLLAAAAAFEAVARDDDGKEKATPQASPLAAEVSRLVRSEGVAAAARLAVACVDASGAAAAHAAAKRGDVDGLDAIVRLFPAEAKDASAHTTARAADGHPESPAPEVVTRRDLLRRGDARGVAPLALAAWRGHARAADYLLRGGADPNARDDYGVAALHKAVGHGHVEVARRILADGGADVNARVGAVDPSVPASYGAESRGQTALHVACRRKQSATETDAGPGPGPAGTATPADARLVATLLRYGADPNARDALGETPLHHALEACDAASARLLARAGADPRARDGAGRTPLDAMEARARDRCNRGLLRDILRAKGAV